MADPLVLFYFGSHPDHRGRYLSEILEQDDLWFEVTHDHIQWLFPNADFSRVAPDAPTLTGEVRAIFVSDSLIRAHSTASYIRMLAFLGLRRTEGGVAKAENWPHRKKDWFTEDTHNSWRITRVLKFLCAIEMRKQAEEFAACLCRLCAEEQDCGISPDTKRYWREAIAQQQVPVGRPRLRRGRP